MDEDQLTDLNNIKRELVVKRSDKNIARLTPQVQNNNRDDYFSLLCENGLLLDYEKRLMLVTEESIGLITIFQI